MLTTFTLPTLITQADAEAVMFELQDLPCISNAGVELARHRTWAEHTRMIDPGDMAAALTAAGHEPTDVETVDQTGRLRITQQRQQALTCMGFQPFSHNQRSRNTQ